jgi:hypothetical protein
MVASSLTGKAGACWHSKCLCEPDRATSGGVSSLAARVCGVCARFRDVKDIPDTCTPTTHSGCLAAQTMAVACVWSDE